MEIMLTVIFALFGVAIGSFLNVCIDRLPAGKSLVYPASHCDACQHPLAPKDLIPVVSYLWLRGRCRYCRTNISPRVLLVEFLGGVLFILAFWRFGLSAEFAITAFWCCVFLVIMFIDWEHKLILNKVTYSAAVVALVILAVNSLLPEPGILSNLIFFPKPSILSGIIGGAAGFIFLLIPALINPRGMGFGDVKMAALIGLVTGFPLALVAVFMGVVLGGLLAVILLLFRIKKRKETIPLGPFLSLATIATLLWGNQLLSWYLAFY